MGVEVGQVEGVEPPDWGMDKGLKEEHVKRCESILSGASGRTNQTVLSRIGIPETVARLEYVIKEESQNRSPGWLARRLFVEFLRVLENSRPTPVAPRRGQHELQGIDAKG